MTVEARRGGRQGCVDRAAAGPVGLCAAGWVFVRSVAGCWLLGRVVGCETFFFKRKYAKTITRSSYEVVLIHHLPANKLVSGEPVRPVTWGAGLSIIYFFLVIMAQPFPRVNAYSATGLSQNDYSGASFTRCQCCYVLKCPLNS